MEKFKFEDVKNGFNLLKEKGLIEEGGRHDNFYAFIQQKDYEWQNVIDIMSEMEINAALEVGSYGGGSLYSISQLAADDATIISIDLHKTMYASVDKKHEAFTLLMKDTQSFYQINADSQLDSTKEWAIKNLNGKELDVLFIDGDHSDRGAQKDFNMYSPLVRNGGIIIFHDIIRAKFSAVDIVWDKLKTIYEHKEFVEDRKSNMGVGVLWYKK